MRLIFIEDSEDDYDLIVRKIKKEGYKLVSKRIETEEEYVKLLSQNNWDAVISDNTLPNYNSTSALKITREMDPFIPFIIVSGTIGEDVAVESMKSGANDYIMKGNLKRLVPALLREIREAEAKKNKTKIEQALLRSESQYKLLADNIQDLVCLHQPDSTYIYVSPSAKRILGYEPEELVGNVHFSYIHPDDFEPDVYENPFKNSDRDSVLRFSYRLRRKDGVYLHVETILQPIYERKELIQIVSTTRDVTEQQIAHDLLVESEARYHSVIESLAEGVILYDHDGNIVTYNKVAREVVSSDINSFDDLISLLRNRYRIVKPDMSSFHDHEFPSQITLETGEPCYGVEMGLLTNDDETWVSINSAIYEQPDGKLGVVTSFSDITGRKQNEDRVNAVASELRELIDSANAPIFGIDWNGRINEWNLFTAKITGYNKKQVLGKKLISEFILDGYKVAVTDLLKSALRGKIITNYELPIYTRSGKVVTILFNATPRKDKNGNINGIVGVGQNITELIDYREKLEQKVAERTQKLNIALEKEKDLVAVKSKFVSMASHEFRTPLATIGFATDYIRKYQSRIAIDQLESKLKKIDEQVKHMTHLLDDVLTIGKGEAQQIKLNRTITHLHEFCEKLVEEVSYSTNNTHRIQLSIASEVNYVWLDEKLLRNIVINLLTNAIKFSPDQQKVMIDVLCQHRNLTILVRDWGMGIGNEDLKKIFDPFHRGGQVGTIQGTGLGLSIVKKAVEIQNGTVTVESEVDEGTVFKVEIPVAYEEEKSISN